MEFNLYLCVLIEKHKVSDMKYTLSFLFGFILFSFSLLAQNFPVSYKISRSFDECSQCNTKTRSTWTLMNKGSFSNQDLKDAIEMKIFTEKSYVEKVGYYFSEQDYEKECPETISGKHVWIPNQTIEKDQITSSQFQNYVSNEKNRVQSEKQKAEEEKRRKEEEKAKGFDACKLFLREYSDLKDLRLKADDLKQKNDIENYLLIQEQVCYKWKTLDSIFNLHQQRWYYDEYYEDKDFRQKRNEFYSSSSTFLQYSDINNFVWNSILKKRYSKAIKFSNLLIKNGDDFRSFQKGTEIEMSIAKNYSHAALLRNEKTDLDWYWFSQRVARELDATKQQKWCQLMIEDYNNFEKLGILKNVDSLKFIIKIWNNQLSISASTSSSNSTKIFIEKHLSYSSGIRGFIGKFNENLVINEGRDWYKVQSKIISDTIPLSV